MTEIPKSEKLRPCPFCGIDWIKEVMEYGFKSATDNNFEHQCRQLTISRRYEYHDAMKAWQNAYCWRELDSEKEAKENALKGVEVYQQRAFKAEAALKMAMEALDDISKFHERGLEEIEKRVGYTGWTCCDQKRSIAEKALSQIDEALK